MLKIVFVVGGEFLVHLIPILPLDSQRPAVPVGLMTLQREKFNARVFVQHRLSIECSHRGYIRDADVGDKLCECRTD